jgi:hypothetical protein
MKNLRMSSNALAAVLTILISLSSLTALCAQEASDEQDSTNTDVLKNLKFRNLGPAAAGGRVTAVAGVPDDPALYYAGSAAGGVFKTTDGGFRNPSLRSAIWRLRPRTRI